MDRRAKAQAIVDSRYPEFQPTLAEFLRGRPREALAPRVDEARRRA